jgi:hypothetical protein
MIDETRAQMQGFATRSFLEEELIHQRPVDARQERPWRSRYEMGKLYWFLGYDWGYHALRSLRSALQDPPRPIGGALLLAGYLVAAGSRAPRYAPYYVRFVRQKQRARMNLGHLRGFLRATLRPVGQGRVG